LQPEKPLLQVSSIKHSDYGNKVKADKKDYQPEFFAFEAEGFPGKDQPVNAEGYATNGIQ
jgi:hypothetical protein